VQHHFGHIGGLRDRSSDVLVQSIFECFLKGGSARWWRNRHHKHHAFPNTFGLDGDLRTTPFVAFDEVLIRR
jgi:fatty acid desaturase